MLLVEMIGKSRSNNKYISNILYPIALVLLSIMNINQGVDVSDATYSLGNYMFPDNVYGTWALSTYISNLAGSFIVRLPYGQNLVGANFYTGLILGIIAVSVYLLLRNELGSLKVFLAECIAICFCWIPTTILYNYLSYLFMVMGCLLLYKGLIGKRNRLLFGAGILFGINVFVRIPNLTQAAFIVVVWLAAILDKDGVSNLLKRTAICISGYLSGVVACVLLIMMRYGLKSIIDMVQGLGEISSNDETYSMTSMIVDTVMAYIHSLKWIVVIATVFAFGLILFTVRKGQYQKIKTGIFAIVILVLYRFLWGKGMFSFRYYEDYSSMYEWGMVTLFLSIIADMHVLLSQRYESKISCLACISFVTIIIAPLGSNNYTFQNINNLFLVTPITIFVITDILKTSWKSDYKNVVTIFFGSLLLAIVVQSFGFHACFAFRDGTRGEKRDTKIVSVDSLKGIYTNLERARNLQEICAFVKQADIESAIFFGDCPGLAYILNIPSPISTIWPDLDSFGMESFEKDIYGCKDPIIIRKNNLSYSNSNAKYEYLKQHISSNHYKCEFENEEYSVYISEEKHGE